MEQLVVAIDGGGTGSRLIAVSTGGEPLLYLEGPPLNYTALGAQAFRENLRALASRLPGRPAVAVAALAGSSPHLGEAGRALREVLGAGQVAVMTDMEALLRAAARGGDGIVVSAGTGSFAYGSCRGRAARAGGWGYLLGDEGSAYWLGREAVRHTLAALEAGHADALAELVMRRLGCHSLPDCIAAAHRAGRGLAGLSRPLCGLSGEPAARLILARGAGLLAGLVERVYMLLGCPGRPLVYGAGGVIRGCGPYASYLAAELGARGFSFTVTDATPLEGALAAALEAAGLGVEARNVISLVRGKGAGSRV